ncbi:MAG: histidine kinase [Burkholderiales bacterium]|nr:histidine kinase [Burkholderiales bacterium]
MRTVLHADILAASWRRWWSYDAPMVGPAWLQLLWTAVFAAIVALPFTVLGFLLHSREPGDWHHWAGWAQWYGRNLIVTLTISYTTHAMFSLAFAMMGAARMRGLTAWQRSVFFTTIPLVALVLSWPIGYRLAGGNWEALTSRRFDGNSIAGSLLIVVFASALFQLVWRSRMRQIAAQMHATEAQLKLLQAQIEPHFLFNTLANVQSLIDSDAPRAKAMLESFNDYLRLSLPQMRRDVTSVGAELDLSKAYLELLSVRMEERLRFSINADAATREAMIPPLLVQPLVENAIRHGLEPKIEGGSVRVEACVRDQRLVITVCDDGLGLDAPHRAGGPPSTGVGLDNVRARLAARHGGEASLKLERLNPGTRATLTLPAR